MSLNQVLEKRSGKRSRLHLDLYTNNREGEVGRLIKIGVTRYPWRYKPDDDFIVLEDPDGNLFFVNSKFQIINSNRRLHCLGVKLETGNNTNVSVSNRIV